MDTPQMVCLAAYCVFFFTDWIFYNVKAKSQFYENRA